MVLIFGLGQKRGRGHAEGYGNFGETIDGRATSAQFDERDVITIEFGGESQLLLA